jgi:hypothetical protein
MESSNTLEISTIEGVVDQTINYLKTWTQHELTAFVTGNVDNRNAPLIARIGKNKYLVGYYVVAVEPNNQWKVIYWPSDSEFLFSSKLSAMLFTICRQTGRDKTADSILLHDQEVSRLSVKADLYSFRFRQAVKKKNSHRIDLFSLRYNETSLKLKAAKFHLEKILNSAKYIKS